MVLGILFIIFIFKSFRPLAIDKNAKDTASTSRDHVIEVSESGLITIAGKMNNLIFKKNIILGGKWTTYRKMSQDTVDK